MQGRETGSNTQTVHIPYMKLLASQRGTSADFSRVGSCWNDSANPAYRFPLDIVRITEGPVVLVERPIVLDAGSLNALGA